MRQCGITQLCRDTASYPAHALPMTMSLRTVLLTALAMLAFAANSLLTREALAGGLADAATFSTLRVGSGAVTLALILTARRTPASGEGGWRGALALFTYVACFSAAYISLPAGTGALILFGTVQLTMFGAALRAGERFPPASWLGLALALGGLVYLMAPGIAAPDPVGGVLMVASGIGWGLYSLMGKGARDPLAATARNFALAVPLVLVISLFSLGQMHLTAYGAILVIASGALASGCGYVLWYAALPHLSAGRAASVQLTVPIIAAIGGAIALSEPLTTRLILSSVVTLGGVALVLAQRAKA